MIWKLHVPHGVKWAEPHIRNTLRRNGALFVQFSLSQPTGRNKTGKKNPPANQTKNWTEAKLAIVLRLQFVRKRRHVRIVKISQWFLLQQCDHPNDRISTSHAGRSHNYRRWIWPLAIFSARNENRLFFLFFPANVLSSFGWRFYGSGFDFATIPPFEMLKCLPTVVCFCIQNILHCRDVFVLTPTRLAVRWKAALCNEFAMTLFDAAQYMHIGVCSIIVACVAAHWVQRHCRGQYASYIGCCYQTVDTFTKQISDVFRWLLSKSSNYQREIQWLHKLVSTFKTIASSVRLHIPFSYMELIDVGT